MSIAEAAPFVAALPQRLLTHPGGGALAVIGHVERAWGYSIRPVGLGNRLLPFRNLLGRVLRGEPPSGWQTQGFQRPLRCCLNAHLERNQRHQSRPEASRRRDGRALGRSRTTTRRTTSSSATRPSASASRR